MTITLDVSPELAGELQQAARTQGTDVPTYLLESARLRLRPDILPEAEASLLHRQHWQNLLMLSKWRTRGGGRHSRR